MNLDSLELEPDAIELAIEPDDVGVNETTMPTVAADVKPVMEVQLEPAPMPLMQILPADFPLPLLARFVPSPEIKTALDQAIADAVALDVKDRGARACRRRREAGGIERRHQGGHGSLRGTADIANRLHKSITSVRASWCEPAETAKKLLGSRMYTEKTRLDKIAADERRAAQAEADRIAREDAAAQVAAAKKNQAPPQIVEQLEQRVKTAVAPPVPVAPPPVAAMKSSTTVTTWKARIKGTPADVEPNPNVEDLSPMQWAEFAQLLRDVADGKAPRNVVEIDWSYLNSRAKSDKSTLTITGIEAFAEGSVRAKGSRGR